MVVLSEGKITLHGKDIKERKQGQQLSVWKQDTPHRFLPLRTWHLKIKWTRAMKRKILEKNLMTKFSEDRLNMNRLNLSLL